MKVGQILKKQKKITDTQLRIALDYQHLEKKRGKERKIGKFLVSHRIISKEELKKALVFQKQKFIKEMKMKGKKPIRLLGIKSPTLFKLIPKSIAHKFEVFPVALKEDTNSKKKLYLAVAEGTNAKKLTELGNSSGCYIQPVPSTKKNILKYIKKYY